MLHSGKGWLIACVAALLAAAVPVRSTAQGVPDSVPVAAISQSTALPVPAADSDAATSTEKIEVIFEAPADDPITVKALEQLDVMIESLEFANADLRNVIRIIGERLRINFIFDAKDIDGKVTLRLHNVRLRDALDSILSSRQLAIVADRSGIFRIVPKAQVGGKQVETKTEIIQLNWLKADDVLESIKSFSTEGIGQMQFNEESNALIITDVPPQVETIKELISQLDVAERQVLIEARLVDINIGALRELGSAWSLTKPNENTTDYPGVLPETSVLPVVGPDALTAQVVPQLLEGLSITAGRGTVGFGDTVNIFGNDYNLNAVVTALETRNVVSVLANPRVTCLNNVPSKIAIIEKIPYIQASGQSSSGNSVPTVAFEEAGVDIQVKPIITPNGFVRMEVLLKQMIFRGRVGTAALDPPLLDVRSATNTVIVKDASTAVLGGLRQQRRSEQSDSVPWLNKIPVLGWLFKSNQVDQSRTELILMMTPRVVKDEVPLDEKEKRMYEEIDNNWNLPEVYFNSVHPKK